MFSSYYRGSNRHHQVVLVECDFDEADRWIRGPRDRPHFLNSQERRAGLKSNRPANVMNQHAVEMLRILNCVPPGCSLSFDQHIGFFEMPSRPSRPLTKATQTDLSGKESSKNVRIQCKPDKRRKHVISNVSHGVRSKQPAPTKQRSQGSSTWKTSRVLTSTTCPNFITVITQSTNNTTRRSPWNRNTKINSPTMTHTLPIRSIMKGGPGIDVSLPTGQEERFEYTLDYTYYLNRHYSEAISMYINYYNKTEVCAPVVQSKYCFLNRVKFIVSYLEGTIALLMHQLITVNAKIGVARFRPVISNVQSSKLYRAVKYASPTPKTTPAPSIVHKPPRVPNFSLVYIENADSYLIQKERPSFKGDHNKSASPRQTPITPRISRHHAEYYVSPTPAGESILHSQQIWTSMVSNRVSPASQKLEMTSSEVQTTPDLLDTLTFGSRTRDDKSKRHSGSIFSLVQRRLHKLGPKSARHK